MRIKISTSLWLALWPNHVENEWFHMVAIWDRTTGLALYVNGCLLDHVASPVDTTFNSNGMHEDFLIGRPNNGMFRYGAFLLDEYYMYEYSQSDTFAAEVYWNYFLNAGSV